MACASADVYDCGDTTDASNPNVKRNVATKTSKVEISAGPAQVKVTNEQSFTRNNSQSKDSSPANNWRTYINAVPYLKLRPARAVQLLMYDDKTVIGACHHLTQTGQLINIINV